MKILAIGAHPGDIEYGCGATIYKYRLKGHHVEMLVVSDGSKDGKQGSNRNEQAKVTKLIGVNNLYWGNFSGNMINANDELRELLKTTISDSEPDLIFTHYPEDMDLDHRIISRMVLETGKNVRNVLFYETVTTYGFCPTVLIDITALIENKETFIKTHQTRLGGTESCGSDLLKLSRAQCTTNGHKIRVELAEGFVPNRLVINL